MLFTVHKVDLFCFSHDQMRKKKIHIRKPCKSLDILVRATLNDLVRYRVNLLGI